MYLFIIPRTPLKYRTSLRDELWEITKKSLIEQTSKNWRAIVVGNTKNDTLNSEYFTTLDFDDYPKLNKIEKALDYIKNDLIIKPEYLIRLDDDDFISGTILAEIDKLTQKHDCYFDTYHTYIDLIYLKISQRNNDWIA